jgi:hypothetical protein
MLEAKIAGELSMFYLSKVADVGIGEIVEAGEKYHQRTLRLIAPFAVSRRDEICRDFFAVHNSAPLSFLSEQRSSQPPYLWTEIPTANQFRRANSQ